MHTSMKMKNTSDWIKYNKEKFAMYFYIILALVVLCVCVFVFHQPVVPICILLLMEAAIASLLHDTEIWIHGIVVVIELIIGILAARTAIAVLLVVCYVMESIALFVINKTKTGE